MVVACSYGTAGEHGWNLLHGGDIMNEASSSGPMCVLDRSWHGEMFSSRT